MRKTRGRMMEIKKISLYFNYIERTRKKSENELLKKLQ